MARNIRWFVTFKAFNGTNCLVNIYDNDWPSGVSMGLRGAADPFYYEEDDSDDLLNDVVRFRTGYIRVIEQNYGDLDAIYPTKTFDRYVEFYYGNKLDFNGYIQVQGFAHPQEPGPRIIELPVISPLGLFEEQKFNTIMPPTSKTLGELMDMVLYASTYQKVTLPEITGIGLWQKVFSLVVSPWNDNYHHSMNAGSMSKVMEPQTYGWFIEAVCKAFGWICHDTPEALIFTSFDYSGNYVYYPVGHIGEANYKQTESVGQGPYALTDFYALTDSKAKQNTLLPETGIEVGYEGNLGSIDFDFQRTYFTDIVTMPGMPADERWSICNLFPVGVINEVTQVGTATFMQDGKVTAGRYVIAHDGKIGVLCSFGGSELSNISLFKIRLYTRKHNNNESWNLRFDGMSSDYSIGALKDDEDIENGYIKTSIAHYDDYVEVTFSLFWADPGFPQPAAGYLIFIHNIRFDLMEDNLPYAEIRFAPASETDPLPSTVTHPAISASVTMPISLYRLNDRLIGDNVLASKVTEYPYLFKPRTEMVGKFRGVTASSPDLFHTRMFTYMSKKWRLLALAFHPWDECEYSLTLQSSPVFDLVSYSISADAPSTSLYGMYTSVYAGDPFTVVLTANAGYTLTSVTVTMGGNNVTSTVYDSSTGEIYIAAVTGNVSITAVTADSTVSENIPLTWINKAINSTQYVSNSSNQVSQEMTFDSSTVKVRVTPGTTKCRYMVYPVFGIALTADDPRADGGWLIKPYEFEFVPDPNTTYVVRIQPYPTQSTSARNALTDDDKPTVTRFYRP